MDHLVGAAEAMLSAPRNEHRVTAPTRNLDMTAMNPDVELDVAVIPHDVPQKAVLSISLGFGGQNLSLVFARMMLGRDRDTGPRWPEDSR